MSIINGLATVLHRSEADVRSFLENAPRKYKVYRIPKRTTGFRIIAQPAKELKALQRAFLQLYSFPVHETSMAYRKGKSIRDNALAHVNNPYLLKTDLEDFFNSITPDIFWRCIDTSSIETPKFSVQDRPYVERILFWQPVKKSKKRLMLSVGAPSSPDISNFCLYEFDRKLSEDCQNLGITYTRYADDLTFSCDMRDVLRTVPVMIEALLKKIFNKALKINHGKTVSSSKAHNRHVTGVTLSNEGNLSLGRERKRFIKHLINQYKYGLLDEADIAYLRGLLAFANHIEPDFIGRVNNKYSIELMERLRRP
ncbi:DNA polymerase [Photorhabdus luminescens subsp. luminescens]|uniref:RNA-directed DNA polymerase n=1 Tax=Photorhabdus luminescens TaxID=29488 RepID=A0A1G5R6P7_PHOLU|nr:retron St85 family RNA-directed DNA polymerase [Photorhabdus luminescens]KMW73211.1 DNA polymerase [Photorhabdus luminescens subsp. luminescens]SCZ69754.1 Retron-type reverse transcriptase [Photorhabdus luminescens]